MGSLKTNVSGRDVCSEGVSIQVTLCDTGMFLHSDLRGQVEKG